MKVGDLVKMKGPASEYSWRQECAEGVGVIIKAPHRTERTMRGCSVFWTTKQKIADIPEDWLEIVSENLKLSE